VAFYPPTLKTTELQKIASITLDGFLTETVLPQKQVMFPFPVAQRKGLVRIFSWDDPTRRAKYGLGSLCLLFNETDDAIFYKYDSDLIEPFNEFTSKILEMLKNNESPENYSKILAQFHEKMSIIIQKLAEYESATLVSKNEFPDTIQFENKGTFVLKIIVVGDPCVGKTSTIMRYTNKGFSRSYLPTIGINITEKDMIFKDHNVQLIFWDVAGQAKYLQVRKMFYNGATAAILVFDLTNRESFQSISKWYQDVADNMKNTESFIMILCGNKKDLTDQIQVKTHEAQSLAQKLKMSYFETSALTGENIELSVQNLVQKHFDALRVRISQN
jgi:small GTP-binding protein